MTNLHEFFKGSDTHLGVFYPNGYLIAIFPSLEGAQQAEKEIRNSGLFQPDEILAVSAIEVIRHDQEHRGTPFKSLMTGLSRLFATEALWQDHDVENAREGCALLAVSCPNEQMKAAAWARIKPLQPHSARHYSLGLGGIEHLAGDLGQ